MRIARILTRLNLGGPARQVLASDPRLVAAGHELRLFVGTPEPGEGDLFETALERGLDVRRVAGLERGLAPAGDLRARRQLQKQLAEFQPDLVHTHAFKAGRLGRRAALKAVPQAARVHTFHGHVLEGYFPKAVARRLARIEAQLSDHTDRIVCVSHQTADDIVRLGVCDESKIVVIQPGIELDPFLAIGPPSSLAGQSRGAQSVARPVETGPLRRLIGADRDVVLAGVVGRLAAIKRCEWAIEVFETVAERYPKLELVFIGDGSERGRLERAIGELKPSLGERVHMVGALEDMPAVLADLDLVLATSRNEGLPVALIEAAAAGRPVVATNVGGVSEIVVHERTGYLGETQDELAYGLARLLDNDRERAGMGQRARLRVERFSADRLAERLADLYTTLVRERQAGVA